MKYKAAQTFATGDGVFHAGNVLELDEERGRALVDAGLCELCDDEAATVTAGSLSAANDPNSGTGPAGKKKHGAKPGKKSASAKPSEPGTPTEPAKTE